MTESTPPASDVERAVAAERLAVADLAAGLSCEQWATPSLCAGWTVREVVAHLTTTTRETLGRVLLAAARARFDFDRMTMDQALALAGRHTTDELVGLLRESARSTRRMPGSGPLDPLMDLVVHAQDIARPLGLRHVTPPGVVAACLAHVATDRFMGGRRKLAGIRLVSTDTGWSVGAGAELRGPDAELLLVAAGRRAGLDALDGPGVAILDARLG